MKPMGRVLTIAGSDPSGGAGIQADIKTITALGGYATSAITTLTVQDTQKVYKVYPTPAEAVAEQIKAVLQDVGADAIKTGMLYSAEIITAIADTLDECCYDGPLVLDPVMVSTSGDRLLDEAAVDVMIERLFSRTSLITPNIPEVAVLTGTSISCEDDMIAAGEALIKLGAEAALLKGGHMDSERIVDVLVAKGTGPLRIEVDKIDTRHTHGTGCTTASAIATLLAQGKSLEQAFSGAHAFVRRAIERAPGFGAGHGPLGHAVAGAS
jgi:hydroxymethylpyrimidine/phosphomethylpyrimidine kinase